MVQAFAATGAKVAVIDIDAAMLETLRRLAIPAVITELCDLADRAQIERVVPRVIAALGGLDVLINNAGIAGATTPVESYDPDTWDQVMRVNLSGTFNVTRLAIPHLKHSRAGSIVNMSSAAGRLGYPQRSAYAASKWGIVGFTKTLSMELGERRHSRQRHPAGAGGRDRAWTAVLEARSVASGRTVDEERARVRSVNQSLKNFTDAWRDRGAGGVPRLGCGEDHLGAGVIHRRRHAPLGLTASSRPLRTDSAAA